MSKPLFFISCPIDTYSGYGARSRDIVKAVIESNQYNVKIIPQRWGNTPWNFIENNPKWGFLTKYIYTNPQLQIQPDIWMQITVPNEFQRVGKYNIGCTAGMETTLVDSSWVEGMNRMDINLVSSEHSKKAFLDSVYNQQDQQGNHLGKLQIEKPIEVLFEGADINTYFPDNSPCTVNFNIPESFAYLFVGHWMQGNLGEDRKNVGLLIKAFYETFKNKKKKPALILKTSQVGTSYMDRDAILKKIKQIKDTVNSSNLPNVYLLHGEFTDEEMNSIYNHSKVKAMISLTKGEGFGRPLLEFSLTQKPIITTNWSGHIDFLNPEFTTLLPGMLKNVDPSAAVEKMILKESQWFNVDHGSVGIYLKDVFENYKTYQSKAKRQAHYSKTNFSWEKMKEKLENILNQTIPKLPKEVKLELPKLKKIELPKIKKVNG
jgi:glycosyltransferase involved in cell wall biosynthesis